MTWMVDAASAGEAGAGPVRLEVEIAAPARVVYAHLVEPELLLDWIAVEAQVEPVVGGVVRWRHENGDTMRGRFVELVPDRRLVFSYGWEGDLMGVPPESTTVEIDLVEVEGGTRLELVHRDLPAAVAGQHQAGWMYFLERMSDAAGGSA